MSKSLFTLLTIIISFSSFAKEISITNKNIRFFNSDIELTKHIMDVFENYNFEKFNYKSVKKFKSKFKKNLRFKEFDLPLKYISQINNSKKFKTIMKACVSIGELDTITENFKIRISSHCFDKSFEEDMKVEKFYKLSAALKYAHKNRRVQNQMSAYLKKMDKKEITVADSDKIAVTKDKTNFLGLIKKIRRMSHSSKKNSDSFKELLSEFHQIIKQEETLKNYTNLKNVEYLVKTLNRHEKEVEARKISEYVVKKTTELTDVFYFELLWSYVSRNQYKEALKDVINKYGLQFNYKTFDNAKLKFWIGHTLESNDIDSYKEIYQDIIDTSPLSFYALISYNRVKSTNKNTNVSLIDTHKNIKDKIKFNLTKKSLDRLVFIRSLIANNSIYMLGDEISLFIAKNSKDEIKFNEKLYVSLASFMQSNKSYLESFKIVYRGINRKIINVNSKVLRLLYPRPYLDIVTKQNKEFDSYLALSLMRQESSFNIRANSSVGAKGLMQLMPRTARGLKKSVKIDDLYNPKTNIKLGVKYLNNLNRKFDKNFVHMLSAYNAGERNVNRWKRNYFISDTVLKNIENIPFNETRKYVKLIFRNIFYYNYLDKIEGREPATETNRLFEKYLQVKH